MCDLQYIETGANQMNERDLLLSLQALLDSKEQEQEPEAARNPIVTAPDSLSSYRAALRYAPRLRKPNGN